ncbi:MAG: hypothetical protein RSB55_09350, partial [Oscillospiraceae bacterium]
MVVTNTYTGFKSTLTGPIQGGLSAKVGTKAMAAGATPVLAGQSVTFTVDTTKTNGTANESWNKKQNYTMGWSLAAVGALSGIEHPAVGTTITGTALKAAVSLKPVVTAKLTQTLYDVVYGITDTATTKSATLASATLSVDTTIETAVTNFVAKTNTATMQHGGKVTFEQIPVGAFTIAGTPAVGSIVKSYKSNDVDGTAMAVTNVKTDNTSEIRNVITIEKSTYSVEFMDDFTKNGTFVNSTGFDKATGLTYGTYAQTDYTVRVKNTGNDAIGGLKLGYADTTLAAGITTSDLATASIKKTSDNSDNGTINLSAGGSLPAGCYAEFTVSIPAGKDAATYLGTFTATGTGLTAATYTTGYTVAKAKITWLDLKVGGVNFAGPAVGEAPDYTNLTLTNLAPASSVTLEKTNTHDVDWTGTLDAGKFAPGRAYTATVTYKADKNHEFDSAHIATIAAKSGYTIDKNKSGDNGASIAISKTAADNDTLTL